MPDRQDPIDTETIDESVPAIRTYKPADVLKAFNCGERSLYRYVERGLLDVIRLPGGARRFRADQVDAILAGEVRA